ncbi:conserved protein of unknown function [Ruminococcaceae bacterium BL-4]|nr:conserved protein of unknown function [Ruminococcaceae bacterium BL-4]
MANEKNLKRLSPSEAREYGSKGGKASGEARRAKKTMREYADFLLSLPVSDRRKWNKLSRAGVPPEGCDNKMLVTFALMQAAQSGDVQAVKELRNLIGEDNLQSSSAEDRIADYLKALEDTVKNEPK